MYNKNPLTETVTVITEALVKDDDRLIKLAKRFWDMEHGE